MPGDKFPVAYTKRLLSVGMGVGVKAMDMVGVLAAVSVAVKVAKAKDAGAVVIALPPMSKEFWLNC